MQGYHDPFNRLPYPWGKEDKNILEYYRCIGEIRRKENVYKDGLFKLLECNGNILAFARYNDDEFNVTIVNRSDKKYLLDSNIPLKGCQNNRRVSVINPISATILKGKGSIEGLEISFHS